MRLINTTTIELRDFPFGNVPPYAILSHTWGAEEVTFQEMSLGMHLESKGYTKVLETCKLARQQGVQFAWVDTCCIDKSSSAELTESINSMFQWYKKSVVCYAYLEDLGPDDSMEKLHGCRWVTRGWTLQELIAPRDVIFYDTKWVNRGTKMHHAKMISGYTGVPRHILVGEEELQDCSVATRMSWVSHRQTTRPEDIAYCMLGIFRVNMPLLYGEGLMAFRRLQEEILRRNNDMTILAWGRQLDEKYVGYKGVLASSPTEFSGSGSITPFLDDSDSVSITNKGLLVSGDIPIRVVIGPGMSEYQYMICLGVNIKREHCMEGLILRKIGPNTFCRNGVGSLPQPYQFTPIPDSYPDIFQEELVLSYSDFYLLIEPKGSVTRASRYREHGIYVAHDPMVSIISATPQTLWDATDRIFLRAKPYRWHHPVPQIIGPLLDYTIDGHTIDLVVLCDYETVHPKCGLRLQGKCRPSLLKAFEQSNITNSIPWPELSETMGERKEGNCSIDTRLGERSVRVFVTVEDEVRLCGNDLERPRGSQEDGEPFSEPRVHQWVVRLGWKEIAAGEFDQGASCVAHGSTGDGDEK